MLSFSEYNISCVFQIKDYTTLTPIFVQRQKQRSYLNQHFLITILFIFINCLLWYTQENDKKESN